MRAVARGCYFQRTVSKQEAGPRERPKGTDPMSTSRLLILGFVAGFVAVLIFHQGLWYLFNQIDLIPPERPAWPLDPTPPFSVPSVISKAFWGGVWGAVLALLLGRFSGASYSANWILAG